MGKYFCKKRKRKIIQCEFFTKNYKQKTDNYFTNSYTGINEGESWGEGEEIRNKLILAQMGGGLRSGYQFLVFGF